MSNPPYLGQGKPLPKEIGLDGDWIIENQVLLCRFLHGKHGLAFPVISTTGADCVGFDADLLAEKMETDGKTLLEMNRCHALSVSFGPDVPSRGADKATFFEFRTPFAGIGFRVNVAKIKGRA